MSRPQSVQGVIAMQRGHKLTHLPSLEMPARFDPSGVPCAGSGRAHPRPAAHRRQPHPIPGLAPTSLIATVEEVAQRGETDWLIWGSVGNRPVLFVVGAAAGAEMMHAVRSGESATAIIEPRQLLLERLD